MTDRWHGFTRRPPGGQSWPPGRRWSPRTHGYPPTWKDSPSYWPLSMWRRKTRGCTYASSTPSLLEHRNSCSMSWVSEQHRSSCSMSWVKEQHWSSCSMSWVREQHRSSCSMLWVSEWWVNGHSYYIHQCWVVSIYVARVHIRYYFNNKYIIKKTYICFPHDYARSLVVRKDIIHLFHITMMDFNIILITSWYYFELYSFKTIFSYFIAEY